jgi:hypothetical protein
VLEPAVGVGAADIDDAEFAIDVALLEPKELRCRSPVAAPKITIGPYTGPSRAAAASPLSML